MNNKLKKIIQKAQEGDGKSQATLGWLYYEGKKVKNHSENHFIGLLKQPFLEQIESCITI